MSKMPCGNTAAERIYGEQQDKDYLRWLREEAEAEREEKRVAENIKRQREKRS
jgi:hypothetical protein